MAEPGYRSDITSILEGAMERRVFRVHGFIGLLVLVADVVAFAAVVGNVEPPALGFLWLAEILVGLALLSGFTVVNPNQARVVLFLGHYVGSLRTAGWHWTVPFTAKRKLSLRARNFETE